MTTYHIITIGCQMNKSDSERIAGLLEKSGYKMTADKYRADLVVVNTCGVRQSAEDRVYGLIPRMKEKNPKAKIVLTGCLVARADVNKRLEKAVDVWLPITDMAGIKSQIPSTKSQTNSKSQIQNKSNNNLRLSEYLSIKPKYASKFSAFVPIGNGCDNFCSYCVVPQARGREIYRPAEEILAEVKNLVSRDYKEIILIAQNVNSYKSQIPSTKSQTNSKFKIQNSKSENNKLLDFADLLKMVNDIPGDFQIKFATSHPKDMSDKLIDIIASSRKVIKEIHLPAQSGDNEILKRMNRKYTVEHYKGLIKKIRRAMPEAKISTDIIVGFPGETKKQFNNTVKLFKEIKFYKAYIARYSPRPGTAAFKLADNVTREEKKRRWRELSEITKKSS